MKTILLLLIAALTAPAQLAVTVSSVKVTGQKAVVPLALENRLSEKIESARAMVFLLDEQGKVIGQPTTRWVIGGGLQPTTGTTNGLASGATNIFHFVVTSALPFSTTNLTAKVQFPRIVFEGGRLGDPSRDVIVTPEAEQ
jgi:hypothetical protein